MVVRHVVRRAAAGSGANDLPIDVDALNCGLDKTRRLKCSTDRLRTVPQLQPSRAGFEQKWRDDEEVLTAHERNLDPRASAQRPLEVACRRHAAESAAQYDDTHM